jgi:hypothetical protein
MPFRYPLEAEGHGARTGADGAFFHGSAVRSAQRLEDF